MRECKECYRLRFSPSPHHFLHIGLARSALLVEVIRRFTGGRSILRIEDLNPADKRIQIDHGAEMIEGLRWLGIEWDEDPWRGGDFGPYRLSEREEIYSLFARQLWETGQAYTCRCSSTYPLGQMGIGCRSD